MMMAWHHMEYPTIMIHLLPLVLCCVVHPRRRDVIDLVNQSTGRLQLPCASLQRVVLRNFNLEGCNLRGACLKGTRGPAPKPHILHRGKQCTPKPQTLCAE
jgi:hypothetical protein